MQIPQLWLGTRKLQGEICTQVVLTALQAGYRHIDTAQIYENHTTIATAVQAFLKQTWVKREEIWITSKVRRENYRQLDQALEKSLRELQTDYLDLLLLHRPTSLTEHEYALQMMKKLQKSGKIRHFGVSNFTLAQLKHARECSEGGLFLQQQEYHISLQQEALKAFGDQKGIHFSAYAPLGRGHLLKTPLLQEIATKHQATVAQVCLARLRQQGVIVLPKASSLERLHENATASSLYLDTEDLQKIAQLPQHHRYLNPPFAPQRDTLSPPSKREKNLNTN